MYANRQIFVSNREHVFNLVTCLQKGNFVSTAIDENLLEDFQYYVTSGALKMNWKIYSLIKIRRRFSAEATRKIKSSRMNFYRFIMIYHNLPRIITGYGYRSWYSLNFALRQFFSLLTSKRILSRNCCNLIS